MKRLAIMDQDGFNVRLLTTGQNLVLTPRFSPSTQEITYTSFEGDTPKVYLLNIETGQKEIVGTFPGMTFAPRFSPDGQRIVMSLEQGGNANLFAMDLRSRRTTQLTNYNAIDTAPAIRRTAARSRSRPTGTAPGRSMSWTPMEPIRTGSAKGRAATRRRSGRRGAT